MLSTTLLLMEYNCVEKDESILHELWPLDEIDPQKAKFPCCVVWTPLPIVSWLAPFIGHVGICREGGAILDFSGSNLINVDDFAFGSVAKYLQLDRKQVCLCDLANFGSWSFSDPSCSRFVLVFGICAVFMFVNSCESFQKLDCISKFE